MGPAVLSDKFAQSPFALCRAVICQFAGADGMSNLIEPGHIRHGRDGVCFARAVTAKVPVLARGIDAGLCGTECWKYATS